MAYDPDSDENWSAWASSIRRDVVERYFRRFGDGDRASSKAFFSELARRGGISQDECDILWRAGTIPAAKARAFAESAKAFAAEFEAAPTAGADLPPWIPAATRESWSHGTELWLIGPDGLRYPVNAPQIEQRSVLGGMELTFRDESGVWVYRGDVYPGERGDWRR